MDIQSSYSGIRRRFSKAQKEQILQEHREQGVPISQLARKNGIHAVTVYQWKRNMTQDDESITPEKIRELLSEISKLKLENKQLKFKVADLSVTNGTSSTLPVCLDHFAVFLRGKCGSSLVNSLHQFSKVLPRVELIQFC
jgi:transposase-like protein